MVDPTGRHGLSCAHAKGRPSRHFQANDLIKRALASADVPAVLEPLGLSNNNNERPDGMSLFPWREGKNIMRGERSACASGGAVVGTLKNDEKSPLLAVLGSYTGTLGKHQIAVIKLD